MNITKNQIDELNLQLTLEMVNEDYADKKKKKLADFRRKADIKGFRKGMVPASLVEKMYGNQAKVDAVNETVSEALTEWIRESGLKVVGEPLPSAEQPQNDWVNGTDFSFSFDVAVNPDINFEITNDDEIPYYTITVTDEAKAEMKANLLKQYGSLEEGEAAGEEDFIIVDFVQGETSVEGTYVAIRNIAEAVKGSVVGLKAGDSIEINVNEAFENETDRAAMLKVEKDELASLEPVWTMTVKNVKTFTAATLCQETYDKIFGEGKVNSEEEFDAMVAQRLAAEYAQESEFKFTKQAKDYLMKKADVQVPEAFLKRWLVTINEGKFTEEQIDKEFDLFLEDYKWNLVRDYLMEKYDIKVEQADMLAAAKSFAAYQFAMYGMNNVPEEHLESYAKTLLEKENEGRRIFDQVADQKTVNAVRANATLKTTEVSVEDFRAL